MLNDGIPCSKNDRIPIGDIYLNFVNVSMIPNNIITPIESVNNFVYSKFPLGNNE